MYNALMPLAQSLSTVSHKSFSLPFKIAVVAAPEKWLHERVMRALVTVAGRESCTGVVVGYNRVGAPQMAEWASAQHLDPDVVLKRIQVVRTETSDRLPWLLLNLDRTTWEPWSALCILGILSNFLDTDLNENLALLHLEQTLYQVKRLANEGLSILITLPPRLSSNDGGQYEARYDRFWQMVVECADEFAEVPTHKSEEQAPEQLGLTLNGV